MSLLSLLLLCLCFELLNAADDLEAAALTVYRNPDFFRHLSQEYNSHLGKFTDDDPSDFFGQHASHDDFFHHASHNFDTRRPFKTGRQQYESSHVKESNEDVVGGRLEDGHNDEEDHDSHREGSEDEERGGGLKYSNENDEEETGEYHSSPEDNESGDKYSTEEHGGSLEGYKYPGEPASPNPTGPPIKVHFDGSPDFQHPPREVVVTNRYPDRGRGPYGHPRYDEQDNSLNYEYEEGAPNEETAVTDQRRNPSSFNGAGNGFVPSQHFPVSHHDEDESYENVRFPKVSESIGFRDDIKETKKGTREYLKHHKLPPNHEFVEKESPDLKVKAYVKKPKFNYISYRIKPLYSHYRIVPLKKRKVKTVFILNPDTYLHRRRSLPNIVDDDSAYLINSELDGEYQIKL